ncbi:hypothetical protein L209DRAFT_758056 [Thermothelomyces heterothallicus CBS 203.75]
MRRRQRATHTPLRSARLPPVGWVARVLMAPLKCSSEPSGTCMTPLSPDAAALCVARCQNAEKCSKWQSKPTNGVAPIDDGNPTIRSSRLPLVQTNHHHLMTIPRNPIYAV